MRPYFAVIVDSFREALYSKVLWILLALITVLLVGLAPVGVTYPLTTILDDQDVRSTKGFAERLVRGGEDDSNPVREKIWNRLSPELQTRLKEVAKSDESSRGSEFSLRDDLVEEINTLIEEAELFSDDELAELDLREEGRQLRSRRTELKPVQQQRLNRLAMEASYRRDIARGPNQSAQFHYLGYDVGPRVGISESEVNDIIKLIVTGATNFVGATIGVFVAILVTASIIPNTFDSGSVNLLFSKPIRRPLLYLAKFLGGCSFVLILASYLIVGLWLIVGWRFGVWHERFLYAIPVLMFLFAVYYSVAGLAGLVWRNTIMVVVTTVLFWLICFCVGQVHDVMEFLGNQPRRVVKIVQAGDSLLTVSENGSVNSWSGDDESWTPVFASAAASGPAFARQNRLLGPIYDPPQSRILAIDRQFSQSEILAGYAERSWARESVDQAPGGSVELMCSPAGEFFVLARDGISKIIPTKENKNLPINLFGREFKIGPKRGSLRPAGPKGYELAVAASAVAMSPTEGAMFVYGDGRLQKLLPQGDEARYTVMKERELFDTQTQVVLAAAGNVVLVADQDGTVHRLSSATLQTLDSSAPLGESPPRMIRLSPDGKYAAVVFHNRQIWLYDLSAEQNISSRLSGQGDLSALEFAEDDSVLVADHIDRIRQLDLRTGETRKIFAADLDVLGKVFHWVVKPLYTVFPKPGELKKTTAYLLTERDSIETQDGGSLSAARMPLDPWAPVWSSAAFGLVMLMLGCVYIQWQEF